MKIFIIIGLFFLLMMACTIIGIFFILMDRLEKSQQETSPKDAKEKINPEDLLARKYKMGYREYTIITLSIISILIAFFAPLIFTPETDNVDFNETGQIGDTIGGLMNPFIALGGVLITGLAFYIQYKANEMQRELFRTNQDDVNRQFRLQQVESQFYEMLKLHRENITEMRISGYDFEEHESKSIRDRQPLKKFEKVTEGRKVFVTMQTELEFIVQLYRTIHTLDAPGFRKCYSIFFSGLDEFEKENQGDKFVEELKSIRKKHFKPGKATYTNSKRKKYDFASLDINYKPFSGHESRLGHYFRHLYLSVRSIANNGIISEYDIKIDYLRLLRAQLSNQEQIMLFYNWLSGYGEDWENDQQQFFTEYVMIHNLSYGRLIPDPFVSDAVALLRNKKPVLRKGNVFQLD